MLVSPHVEGLFEPTEVVARDVAAEPHLLRRAKAHFTLSLAHLQSDEARSSGK
jgi:hypothetical protein